MEFTSVRTRVGRSPIFSSCMVASLSTLNFLLHSPLQYSKKPLSAPAALMLSILSIHDTVAL